MTVVRDPNTQPGQKVNTDGNALTRAITESELAHVSEDNGLSYSWSSGTYNVTGADTVLLVKNTADIDLHINKVWLSTDTDTRVVIHLPTILVSSPTGTAVPDINLNTNNANDEDLAVAIRDETTNVQGDIIWSGEIMAADSPYLVEFEGACILAKNRSIGVDYVGAPGACDVTIIGHFDPTE